MSLKKIIFGILVATFMISCTTETIYEMEVVEISEQSLKRVRPQITIQKRCNYIPVRVRFYAGRYSGCELYNKMVEKRQELSRVIDNESGCPKFKIPTINYFNCQLMTESSYVEYWEILPEYHPCPNCTDDNDNPLEPDSEMPIEWDDDFGRLREKK